MPQYLPDSKLAVLEYKAMMVNSDLFASTYYGIHKDKKGMSLISGNQEIAIAAENVIPFLTEAIEVWKTLGEVSE